MRLLAGLVVAAALAALPALAGDSTQGPSRQARARAIPEPAAVALFVLGAGVVGVAIRRRQG